MKSKKIDLEDLKVKSFVTKLDEQNADTVIAGNDFWHSWFPTNCGGEKVCGGEPTLPGYDCG